MLVDPDEDLSKGPSRFLVLVSGGRLRQRNNPVNRQVQPASFQRGLDGFSKNRLLVFRNIEDRDTENRDVLVHVFAEGKHRPYGERPLRRSRKARPQPHPRFYN